MVSYKVTRATGTVELGSWDKGQWQSAKPLDIALFMGAKPEHIPRTQAKVLYDDQAVYVAFRVEDNYVRAIASHQGSVCRDSCVEFFFIPSQQKDKGYFNLEMNCGGTMLFHFQLVPRQAAIPISDDLCKKIEVYHQLPEKIDPEIAQPTTWIVAYKLPVSILKEYAPVADPAPGVKWLANFYKCADATSHPHWLTWAKVNKPKPDFHVPESYAELVFD
ncbi:MAG: hypothetical protein A2Y07_02130 [Planctomycetes bacterium GWF2_50_10]|nr:MAG: hypothetical protein A2Y07_02130 [Planctomycetes bacterium GWF2_50_10]